MGSLTLKLLCPCAGQVSGEPYFLVLDSMGEKHGSAVTNIRGYLDMEWRAKVGPLVPPTSYLTPDP